MKNATKSLYSSTSTISDVVPIYTCTIDFIRTRAVPARIDGVSRELISSLSLRLGMLLCTNGKLPLLGGRKFTSLHPTEVVVASYLNPRYYMAMRSTFGYTERSIPNEIAHIFKLHRLVDELERADDVDHENDNSKAQNRFRFSHGFTKHLALKNTVSGRGIRTLPFRDELSQYIYVYISEVSARSYTDHESRKLWVFAVRENKFPKLNKVAVLLHSVPSSSIPQQKHFSEFKRRCNCLRARPKIETLDRYTVVYVWYDEPSSQ